MKKLLGVHGKRGSGKDTVAILAAQYIRKVHHMAAKVVHYADPLKSGLAAMFGIPVQYFHEEGLKEAVIPELGVTPRSMMTKIHDLLVPVYGDQIWVRPVRKVYEEWLASPKDGVFIVADVRYEFRETDWIREAGGIILHVHRERTDGCAGNHSSEGGLMVKAGDRIILNNSTLIDLRAAVWKEMEAFMYT